jgi:hypothetical protein
MSRAQVTSVVGTWARTEKATSASALVKPIKKVARRAPFDLPNEDSSVPTS